MKMPIVSITPMAMNESVCATCCYKIITSPSNYYWEVLGGGWLGQRPEDYPAWRETIDAGWMELPFDVDFSEELGAIPFYNEAKKEWWVQYTAKDNQLAQISLEDFVSGENGSAKKMNENCLHNDSQCLYYAVSPPPLYREHIESTSPHVTAAGVFRAPHRALQYDS